MIAIIPLLLPFATGISCVLLRKWKPLQRVASLLGSTALLIAAGILVNETWTHGYAVLRVGSWQPPFGISFAADLLSSIMVLIAAFLGLAVNLFSIGSNADNDAAGFYHALYHFLLMGVCGAFLTGDLFNLYVWFEVFLISSFVLLVLSGSNRALAGGLKYIVLSLFGSALFLAGLGLVYNSAGTLNMADLALAVKQGHLSPAFPVAVTLMGLAFAAKAAIIPLHFWLPASYHTPSIPVAALFAGLLTKVGVYALIRLTGLGLVVVVPGAMKTLLILSSLTMLIGVLGAASQMEIRRILSFHIISQIGYMTMGLALMSLTGIAGAIFYLIHHIVVKTNLFLVTGVIERLRGHSDLERLGGLKGATPWLALGFAIPALSLAGVPPLSGFWAKLLVIKGALEARDPIATSVALATGLLTLFSMTKIWNQAFLKAPPQNQQNSDDAKASEPPPRLRRAEVVLLGLPIALFCIWTLAMGLAAEPAARFSERSASQILNPDSYIQAVLGNSSGGLP